MPYLKRALFSNSNMTFRPLALSNFGKGPDGREARTELELELIQTQMTQKPMLRAEVGMRVRCANKASAECIMRGRGIGQNSRKNCKKRGICG